MRLSDAPPYLKEALAIHEAFRRLGFSNDDIKVVISGPDGNVAVTVALMRAGTSDFEFVVDTGGDEETHINRTKKEIGDDWQQILTAWNDPGQSEASRAIWHNSWIHKNSVRLLVGLREKGISWPNLRRDAN